MFPIQEITADMIGDMTNNQFRAILISQLFGIQLTKRYTDKQWKKILVKFNQQGYDRVEHHININFQTHEKYIERFQHEYGFEFGPFIWKETKENVKPFVDDLMTNEKADFNELLYKHKLLTNTSRIAYESHQKHIKQFGTAKIELHEKPHFDDLISDNLYVPVEQPLSGETVLQEQYDHNDEQT